MDNASKTANDDYVRKELQSSNSIVSAFTDEQTARLTGLSVEQLRNWDRTGFFSPALAAENRRSAFSRIYTFQDLLSLHVLKALKNDYGCSLQHLRQVKKELAKLGQGSWSDFTLYVLNKRVVIHDKKSSDFYEPVDGQKVFKIPLRVVQRNMQNAVNELWERPASSIAKTEKRRRVAGFKEVLSGTRVTIDSIRDFITAGYSDNEIVEEFPSISIVDVQFVRERLAA